jgi:D-glycero-beta-D-manno-heptose-7-phosphate kinase
MPTSRRSPAGASDRAARLPGLVRAFAGRVIVVAGDFLADEFIYGQIARVSREAPVLILQYDSTEVVPGGAGNAANNVAALGGRARAVGLVGGGGRDEPGRRMLAALHRRVDRTTLVRSRTYRTPTKTRILAGGIHSAKQQVVRIDRQGGAPDRTAREAFARQVRRATAGCDGVLFSDYGSGLVTPALVSATRRRLGARVPVLVDSRYDLLRFSGLTACTPNESEVEQLLGIRIEDDLALLEQAGRTLLERTRMKAVLVTRGSRGMALFEPRRPTVHIPIVGSDEIADVTGAGDTVIATMALALAAGGSFEEAARLANHAGGLVVMKRGTATVSASELSAAIQLTTHDSQLTTQNSKLRCPTS